MTDPFAGEFKDVLSALGNTEIPMPSTLEGPVASALAAPDCPERVSGIEAAISRDADEAWSLAMAFLADEDAAWEALVTGFVRLGKGDCVALSQADSLRAVAEAALEIARLLAKGGHEPDVCGAGLQPEVRLGVLIRGGLRHPGLDPKGTPDLSTALLEAYPRPGHERGDELCRLLARDMLGALEPDQAETLKALRREHPTSATLIRERYAEVAEVPLLVLPRIDELEVCVARQLALDSERQARVGAVQLRVTVTCSFCHDGLGREEAVFCSGCLAPHHEECFRMHGRRWKSPSD